MSRANKFALTDSKIRKIKPPTDKASVVYWDSQSKLGLKVLASGTKTFIVRVKKFGVGRAEKVAKFDPHMFSQEGQISQTEIAREEARARASKLTSSDMNPQAVAAKEKEQRLEQARLESLAAETNALQSLTLLDVKNQYLENSSLRPSTVTGYRTCVKEWDNRPVAEITIADCREWHKKTSENSPIAANREMQYLRALLNFIREEHADPITGEYRFLPINVVTRAFRKVGKGQSWNAKGVSKTRINKNKIGLVVNELELLSDKEKNKTIVCTGADLVLFLLLTGCRIGESRSLTWENVNLKSNPPTFKLKADTVKTGEEVILPLSDALVVVLKRRLAARRRDNKYVFPAVVGKSGYVTDPRKLFLKISEIAGSHITPHAMRRTFVDIARTVGVDSGERRILLNHKVARDVHDENYENNHDPIALYPAVNRIGEWVTEQAAIARGENVVDVSFVR